MFRSPVHFVRSSNAPRHAIGAAATAIAAIVGTAGAAQVVSHYVGPVTGSWSTPGNWSPFGIPNNGGGTTYYVIIDGAGGTKQDSVVVLDSARTIDSLEIYEGDELQIANAQALAIVGGAIQNMNRLSMMSVGNGTDLRLGAAVLIGGDGELVMSDNFGNIIRNNFGAVQWLTHGANHTIRGSGQVGADSLFMTNLGIIQADQSNELRIDLNGSESNLNMGTFQATGGALMRLYHSGTINNTNGLIRANNASTMMLEGTHILGGTLTTVGTGEIIANGATPHLQDLHNTGFVRIPNAQTMAFSGTMVNDATFRIDSVGNGTDFRVNTAELLLTGPGTLSMSDNPNNVVRNNFGAVNRLINNSGHSIRGAGQMGADSLFLTNDGLVQADQSNSLHVDLRPEETNFNNGLMLSTSGATLRLYHSGTIDNTNGLIRADNASAVMLEGTHILGGTLTTLGTGQIFANGATPHLQDLHNAGFVRIPNAQTMAFSGTMVNDATFRIDSAGNGTDFRVNTAELLLTGPGTLSMSDNPNNVVRNNFGAVNRLINDSGHSVRGAGQLGADSLFLTNDGLVQADQSNSLHVDLRPEETNFNNGLMLSTSGATLRLYHSGTIDNTNGLIRADNASAVMLEGTHILGGTLTTLGTGQIFANGATPHLQDLHNTGFVRIPNAQTMLVTGTIVNDATIRIDSVGNGTDFRINTGDVTLTGSGELTMSDNSGNLVRNNFGPVTRLVNDSDHTIRGAGQVGANSLEIINRGAMVADLGASMLIDPADAQGFTNEGFLHVTGAGSATISWGNFTTNGEVLVDSGRTLARNGDYTQNGGTTTVNGALQVNSGTVQLIDGTLEGTGTVSGGVNNSGGVVAPGNSTGTLTVNGGYQQGAGGVYDVELAGFRPGDSDFLSITGPVQLSGVLTVGLQNGFNPTPGTQFTILQTSGGTITGQFQQIVPCRYIASYTSTSVTLTVGTTVLADINCDGVVNGNDLAIVLGAWGPCGSPVCQADLNNDGVVNGNDLAIVLGNWG